MGLRERRGFHVLFILCLEAVPFSACTFFSMLEYFFLNLDCNLFLFLILVLRPLVNHGLLINLATLKMKKTSSFSSHVQSNKFTPVISLMAVQKFLHCVYTFLREHPFAAEN